MRMAVILIKHMLTLWTMQFHMNSSGSHPSTFIEGMADTVSYTHLTLPTN